MTIGAPIVVIARWSRFYGQRGVVVSLNPTMVQLVGEPKPLRFDDESIAPASSPAHHGGAE
jgi:hypothetical protein